MEVGSSGKSIWNEVHRFYGFLRFSQMGGGILYARISPENDILAMLADHFENRLPNENWIVYDENRNKALVHEKGKKCLIRLGVKEIFHNYTLLSDREEYEQLWRNFCRNISITERENLSLQRQFVPLKFRSNMLEFDEN